MSVVLAQLAMPKGMTDPSPKRFEKHLPDACEQVLLVTTRHWTATKGTLQRYVKEAEGNWKRVEASVPVVVGRAGLGWGRGLHPEPTEKEQGKREGDGRAPAGIFELGTGFGYAPEFSGNPKLRYRQSTGIDLFVDNPESPDYNRWVQWNGTKEKNFEAKPEDRWGSFERMRRDDHLYEFGVVIRHNMDPSKPGAGSAIFLHVWRSPDHPTAGCTAMSREDLTELLSWLDSSASPILIQIPQTAVAQLE
tara:strand:- start:15258 stop:16004 length:747 start_codon:yes stop_codon:yes gene_type:complete